MLGSYAAYLVGQWTGIAGVEGERAGNLHFAGEHTSTAFQGFMEGAAETGAAAAMEVLADLGIGQDGGMPGMIGMRARPLRQIVARAQRLRLRRA
jgi:monoamine oxidase